MGDLFEMFRPRVPDAAAREQALDIERSWVVEAPAGSGKTGLLIQRYLRLLADPSTAEPEQVLAITFTKAAAEEIRERVLQELQYAADSLEPKSDYDRVTRELANAVLWRDHAGDWRLLDEPRRLRVRTIDAVCAEIARSLPITSGGNGSLSPVEEASSLYREAARRTWLRLGGEDAALSDALRSLLLHRDGDLQACISLVAEMLREREQWGSLVPLRDEDLTEEALDSRLQEQLNQTLEAVVCEGLGRLARAFSETALHRLANLANDLSDRSGYGNQTSPIAVCRELHSSPTDAAAHLVYWRALTHLLLAPSTKNWRSGFNSNHIGFLTNPKDRASLKQIALEVQQQPELLDLLREVGSLPPIEFPAEQWPITKALFRVLRQALADLQLVFSETGLCDFAELSLLAGSALRQAAGPDNLEIALGTELKHLLVDEMQDTSTRQYDLIERLTDGWADERKTIFLVGDPKQSIYLFRQARVERFVETMRTGRLGQIPLGLLQLTANFRSQAGLVTAFNQDFGRIFPHVMERAEDVNYVQAAATKKVTPGLAGSDGSVWHLTVLPAEAPEAQRKAQTQLLRNARQVRERVDHWRAKPLPQDRTAPWKIAVLVQSRRSLARVLPELRRADPIPIRALKIDTLHERREVLDLLALTRALLHPADRTAWLAVLHAPWCGLGLADLHILTGKDDPRFVGRTMMKLIDAHGTELSVNGTMRLERAWPVLNAALRSAGRIRLPERVERTWRSLGGDAFLDDTALKNVSTFLDLLRNLDRDEGEVTVSELTRRVKRLYASSAVDDDAVDLVTIHGAKGLEWDVVLVPELERRAPTSRSRLFEWEELLDGRVVLAPIAAKGKDATALNGWLRSVRSRREVAERKRLFYVACTRAREELHLFGIAWAREGARAKPDSGSLLEAAWPAAEQRVDHDVDRSPALKFAEAGSVLDLAAAAEDPSNQTDVRTPTLERLPLSFQRFPQVALHGPATLTRQAVNAGVGLPRGDGSFASRCLGTTVHTFLEETARRVGQGSTTAQLIAELSENEPRIRAVLRASGLPPSSVDQQLRTVTGAIRKTLSEPIGQWILGARTEARNEFALAGWQETTRHARIDRIFRAGATPRESGDQYLWIIDYKTTVYAGETSDRRTLQAFFARERAHHAAQLEGYARLVSEDHIRLGLWFPLIGKFTWWCADESSSADHVGQTSPDVHI